MPAVVVAEVGIAKARTDRAGTVVCDVSHGAGARCRQGIFNGAEQHSSWETFPQSCRLCGRLLPGVHQTSLVCEAGLHLRLCRPVELVALLVRVEEGAAGVALKSRSVWVDILPARQS